LSVRLGLALFLVVPFGIPDAVASYIGKAKKLCEATQLSVGVPTDVFTPSPMLEAFSFNSGKRPLVSRCDVNFSF
jgi:hypothetical protein